MKILASLLEIAGVTLVFVALATWSPVVAIAIGGIVLITVGYNLGGNAK